MFRETEQGETQYCPMCEEWAEKYERLQAENEELKEKLYAIEDMCQELVYENEGFVEIPLILGIVRNEE